MDAGILIMVQGTVLRHSLPFDFFCGTLPSSLKVGGWVGSGWVASNILVSAPVPFGFRSYWDLVGVGLGGLGTKGSGTGLDNYV